MSYIIIYTHYIISRAKRLLLAAAAAMCGVAAQAMINLPYFYDSGMVLQRNAVVTVRGTATPGLYVRFEGSWNGEKIFTKVDSAGNFEIKARTGEPEKNAKGKYKAYYMRLYEVEMNGDRIVRTVSGRVFSNILLGDVWLCSGQSNMEMPVQGWGMINNNAAEVADATYPEIRIMQVKMAADKSSPADDTQISIRWTAVTPSSIPKFSALAYLFGRNLYKELDVPIGLMQCAYGGSTAEAWVSLATAKSVAGARPETEHYEAYGFDPTKILAAEPGKAIFQVPTMLYNTMLYPLHVLPIRGAIWYQGEANAGRYSYYTELMDSLISNWRSLWGYNFPFYYMQLAGFGTMVENQPESSWAALRWAQTKTLAVDSTGMATCIDIGNQTDIHPKNKQEAARRLALVALRHAYGRDVVAEAPVPVKCSYAFRKATITFNRPIHVRNDSTISGFIIRERASGNFVKATATLTSDTTIEVVSSKPILKAVRYAWADYPIGNLYGENDLPVLPFRTDELSVALTDVVSPKVARKSGKVDVYALDGALVKRGANAADAKSGLPRGIYIIGDKKVAVE